MFMGVMEGHRRRNCGWLGRKGVIVATRFWNLVLVITWMNKGNEQIEAATLHDGQPLRLFANHICDALLVTREVINESQVWCEGTVVVSIPTTHLTV